MIPAGSPRIIVPDAEAAVPSKDDRDLTLDQCKRVAIEKHLVEQMKRPEHEAKLSVRDTKGSLIALLWQIGSGPVGIPHWASRKDATTHASLMLAGSWLGDNDDDAKVSERLSRKEYRDIETLLQSAQLPEGPWIHRGTEWRCVSRDFVWKQLIGKVTETMLKDFQEITRAVLGEPDPALELPRLQRSMAGILGKKKEVFPVSPGRIGGLRGADCDVSLKRPIMGRSHCAATSRSRLSRRIDPLAISHGRVLRTCGGGTGRIPGMPRSPHSAGGCRAIFSERG